MQPAHLGAGLEIGERAGHAHHAVIAPRRELEALRRGGEQLAALGIGGGDLVQEPAELGSVKLYIKMAPQGAARSGKPCALAALMKGTRGPGVTQSVNEPTVLWGR